jgi:hypothetical protein
MSFTISKGAKKLTIGLLTGGLILFLVGLFMDMSHDDAHTGTRLMTNLLTNSFYFFAVGLGALFFLALLYATETGLYSVVKKII